MIEDQIRGNATRIEEVVDLLRLVLGDRKIPLAMLPTYAWGVDDRGNIYQRFESDHFVTAKLLRHWWDFDPVRHSSLDSIEVRLITEAEALKIGQAKQEDG